MNACAHPKQTRLVDGQVTQLCRDCLAELPPGTEYAELDIYVFDDAGRCVVPEYEHRSNPYKQLELPFLTPAEHREIREGAWEQ